ncbi:MAG: LLM class F420-dependent oxidoreductase [Candidatus Dormibacteraeota bacterium]|nr:LLM class F420-dependent oxidoreductase [Candidatus Dormibacteraeota bacterium]
MDIGTFGIWSGLLRNAPERDAVEAARQIEAAGFTTAWLPSGEPGQLERVRALIEGTGTLRVATGILNVYRETDPERTAGAFHEIEQAHPERFLLGLGVGHPQALEPGQYGPPIETMSRYLDGLDHAAHPVPINRRVLAALRPRMLRLSRDRSLGAHPYLTTPEHTARAREILGPEALLAPEQGVVLETDPTRARQTARANLARYLQLTNYLNSFRWLGFGDRDFEEGGSDRLMDALVAWGDVETVAERLRAHVDAGASHVTIQVLTDTPGEFPVAEWRSLAQALID